MASGLAGMIRRSAAAACVVVVLLPLGLARAQTDAGANPPPAEPDPQTVDVVARDPAAHDPAARDPNASAPSAEPPPTAEGAPATGGPGAATGGFPKALTPQQSSPENLQGWLRERNRRHPGLAERAPFVAPPGLAPAVPGRDANATERAVEGYRRRLQSFDEGGVTVLSNRHALQAPPLARVQGTQAAPVPPPQPVVVEPDREESSVTETRSLRTNQLKARGLPSEHGLGWAVFAVPVAAISLTLLWLRKRRTTS